MHFWEKLKRHFLPSHHNAYRPHVLRSNWLGIFLAIVLAAEGFMVANLVARQSSQSFLAAVVSGDIIALTNEERITERVGTLTENAKLTAAAQAKADDMAAKGYFSHVGPDGKEPWTWISEAQYDYKYAGENLAVRFVDSSDVVKAWIASPSHRANLVKGVYTDIGIGVANGTYQGQPAIFVVQYFGKPVSVAATVAVPPTPKPVVAVTNTSATPTTPEFVPAKPTVVPQAAPKPEVVAASPTPAPQVEGAAVTAQAIAGNTAHSFYQSLERQLTNWAANPRTSAQWAIGSIVLLVLMALAFASLIHIRIQPTQLLAGGSVFAIVALSLFFLNAQLLGGLPASSGQGASVASAIAEQAQVVIPAEAASTER